jgi:hypothetical protein
VVAIGPLSLSGCTERAMISLVLLLAGCPKPMGATESQIDGNVTHVVIETGVAPGELNAVNRPMSERDRVLSVFQESRPVVTECFLEALTQNPALWGEIVVGVQISEEGGVTDVQTIRTSIPNREMIDCVKLVVESLTFPNPARGSLTVSYPYLFTTEHTPAAEVRAMEIRYGLRDTEAELSGMEDPSRDLESGENGWWERW